MLQILKAYGIPTQLVDAVAKTYEETPLMSFPDSETEFFKITTGLLQGDTLAPYLFTIALNYALREAIEGHEESLGLKIEPRQEQKVKAEKATDLNFAEDIALFSNQF